MDCGGVLGVLCATAQTAESSKIAVIKEVFLIASSWLVGLIAPTLRLNRSGVKDLECEAVRWFACFVGESKAAEITNL